MRWVSLFDHSEVERVVDLLREDLRAQDLPGYSPTLHGPMRSILIGDLEAYLAEQIRDHVGVTAALALQDYAEDLAERIESGCISDPDPDHLRLLWLEFIAAAGGHRMYHDLPEEAARKKRGGKRSAESRQAKRASDLETAARALANLRERNDVKIYRLGDLTAPTGLTLERLKKLTMIKISALADEILRK